MLGALEAGDGGLEQKNSKQVRGKDMKITTIIPIILAASVLLMPALVRTPQAIQQEQAWTDPAQSHRAYRTWR
jgi:hypothetical protein